ncbi:MAG: lipoprotein-releasing ABC transporter permease subunit [Alphaproteobacteria bacterium]
MIFTEIVIAIKYLQARKKEAFISINAAFSLIGIAIGVSALIVVMSIMNGFRIELTNKIVGLNSDVIVSSYNGKSFSEYNKIIDQIKLLPSVEKIYPVVIGQALVSYNNESLGVFVKALNIKDLKDQQMISENIIRGDLYSFNEPNSIIIGEVLARTLGAKIGSQITLVSPQFNTTVIGQIPRMKVFTLVATFNSGLNDFDRSYVIMSLQEGQKFYDISSKNVNQIEVFTKDPYNSPKISLEIMNLINNDDLLVSDWQQVNVHIFNALKTEKVAMFVILTLIIIVASFNIVSSLVMLVIDKTREIAILRTLGMTKSSIMRIFLICGMLIGFSGTVIGVSLGVIISYNINTIKDLLASITNTRIFDPVVYYLDSLPSNIDIKDVLSVMTMSLILSFCSTLYPAWKASKLSPIEGLKNE